MKRGKLQIHKILLEKNFLNANKEIIKLPQLRSAQIGRYLYSKGFKNEGKKFYKENLDGKTFILLMTSQEGVSILEDELGFKKEAIEKLKVLYKNIYLFRKKFCGTIDESEQPFY